MDGAELGEVQVVMMSSPCVQCTGGMGEVRCGLAGQQGGAASPTCSSPLGYLSMESDWAAMAFTAAAAHTGAF